MSGAVLDRHGAWLAGDTPSMQWAEARDTAHIPTGHGTAPENEEGSRPPCAHNAEAEESRSVWKNRNCLSRMNDWIVWALPSIELVLLICALASSP